jgi:hypothetical protein
METIGDDNVHDAIRPIRSREARPIRTLAQAANSQQQASP